MVEQHGPKTMIKRRSRKGARPLFTMNKRRKTKTVKIGSAKIGAGYPVSIQSMTKTDTACIAGTVRQIKALEREGCEIVRVAVKNGSCAQALDKIKKRIDIPLVADIHFNYRLGLEAIASGVDGLRLNPGNIYRREEVKQIAQAARKRKIPIRIGVNSGSLRSTKYEVRNTKVADAMVKSALDYIKMLESFDFYDIIVSLKASDVSTTVSAYRKMAGLCLYPFHLGITACGLPEGGAIKSAMGIGTLLLDGIGDTIRVSLTGTPEQEVIVAKNILQSLGLRNFSPEIIACPTCGRTQIDVVKIAKQINDKLSAFSLQPSAKRPFRIAIMGCEVNGPGEARDADIGIAGGKHSGILFKKGRIIKKVSETKMVETLIKEIGDNNG